MIMHLSGITTRQPYNDRALIGLFDIRLEISCCRCWLQAMFSLIAKSLLLGAETPSGSDFVFCNLLVVDYIM